MSAKVIEFPTKDKPDRSRENAFIQRMPAMAEEYGEEFMRGLYQHITELIRKEREQV